MNATTDLALARRLASDGTARRLRLEARLSLRDVASAVRVNVATVSRWERGQRVPHGDAALRYSQVLVDLMKVLGR
jgi:transcriptional regulator with XRE-family HTH domain